MAKVGKILIIIATGLLWRCSTNYDEVAPDTILVITIVNPSGALISGASIYTTTSKQTFNTLVASGGASGGLTPAVTGANGVASVTIGVDSVYVYAIYKNESLFPGTYITEDNSDGEYTLKNEVSRGSVSSLQITVKPADGFITFWTTSANNTVLPINVFLATTPGGVLNQSASSPPGLFQLDGLTVRARKGNITIEGKSTSGCLWADQVLLGGGQSVNYQLVDCSVGTVAFYTDNTNSAKLPITLLLNANDVVPNISVAFATTPLDCLSANLAKAFRTPGTYTYEAISPTGNCVWTGTFTLAPNDCKLISMATCN